MKYYFAILILLIALTGCKQPSHFDLNGILGNESSSSVDKDSSSSKIEYSETTAHVDGGVPNIKIELNKLDEHTLGQLIYFFEKACGISGYMLGVNPFNQPGVEAYKKNMFALLEKPGYEKETEAIKAKLK